MVKKTENELNFSHNLNFVQFYHLFLPLKVRFLFFFCFTSSRRGMKLFCVNTYNLRLTLSCGWVKHANTQKGFAYFSLWQFITHSLFCSVLSCLNTQHAGGWFPENGRKHSKKNIKTASRLLRNPYRVFYKNSIHLHHSLLSQLLSCIFLLFS